MKSNSSFKNIKIIGEGTYGKVYKATTTKDNIQVAIKKIPIEDDFGISVPIIREIKQFKRLKNPNIVKIFDIFNEEDFFYVVMEYIPYDLTGLIKTGFIFDDELIFYIAFQLLKVAAYIHNQGIVHRDIKSSNILITKDCSIKLIDFGLSRDTCTLMTNRVCTLWFRAPELLLGSIDYTEKVDSFSIGCVILDLKFKKVPFRGSDELTQIKNIFNDLGAPKNNFRWSDLLESQKYLKEEDFKDIIYKLYSKKFSEKMLSLLEVLLNPTPDERLSPEEALKLPFFKDYIPKVFNISVEDVNEYSIRDNLMF